MKCINYQSYCEQCHYVGIKETEGVINHKN